MTCEVRTLEELYWTSAADSAVVASVVAFPWVQDGIEYAEANAIDWLNNFPSGDTVMSIVSMPFLETLEPPDVSALESLVYMAWFSETDYQRVISHPTLSNGITDDWTKIVAIQYDMSEANLTSLMHCLTPLKSPWSTETTQTDAGPQPTNRWPKPMW